MVICRGSSVRRCLRSRSWSCRRGKPPAYGFEMKTWRQCAMKTFMLDAPETLRRYAVTLKRLCSPSYPLAVAIAFDTDDPSRVDAQDGKIGRASCRERV